MNHRKAFTLIELLVVIAIIAILAAILFPVFAQAKLAAKKTSWLASVKQVSLSNVIYANDFDDLFPYTVTDSNGDQLWDPGTNDGPGYVDLNHVALPGCATFNGPNGSCTLGANEPGAYPNYMHSLLPYTKSQPIFVCNVSPQGDYDVPNTVIPSNLPGDALNSIIMNGVTLGISETRMSSPANLITISTNDNTSHSSLVQPSMFNDGSCNSIDVPWFGSAFGVGDNYGFADGHAKYSVRTAVTFKMYGVSSNVQWLDYTGNQLPNTTGMLDPKLQNIDWTAGGTCDVTQL